MHGSAMWSAEEEAEIPVDKEPQAMYRGKLGLGTSMSALWGMERKDISLTSPRVPPKEAQKLSNI